MTADLRIGPAWRAAIRAQLARNSFVNCLEFERWVQCVSRLAGWRYWLDGD